MCAQSAIDEPCACIVCIHPLGVPEVLASIVSFNPLSDHRITCFSSTERRIVMKCDSLYHLMGCVIGVQMGHFASCMTAYSLSVQFGCKLEQDAAAKYGLHVQRDETFVEGAVAFG